MSILWKKPHNIFRMNDYEQPGFYRFNQDSLELVKWVKQYHLKASSILDLGAGCGIIGMELAQHFKPQKITLLEFQKEYEKSLTKNAKFYLKDINHEIVYKSFSEWNSTERYDLIVSNPPYYLPDSGQPSLDHRRQLARSFVRDNWEILLKLIEESLAPEGKSFVVIKNDPKILAAVNRANQKLHLIAHSQGNILILELALS